MKKKNHPPVNTYKVLNYGCSCVINNCRKMQRQLQLLPKSQICIITKNCKKMQPQLQLLSKSQNCVSTEKWRKILLQLRLLPKPQNWVICCEHHFKTLTYICFLIFLPQAAAQDNEPDRFADSTTDSTGFNQFSPSLAVIISVLVAALLLMGFFSIYLRHCTNSTSEIVGTHAGTDNRSRKAARGLDKAVIETFPILEYSEVKIHKIGKEALECAVCLCEFEDTETLRLIPKCDHVFHPECIDEWLSSHTTCPVCRANLVPQPGESIHGFPILNPELTHDIEAQNDAVIETVPEQQNMDADADRVITDPETETETTLNRNRTVHTRVSRSNRPRKFPRSHSTGHSLVQPGENLERFTLRLPLEVRKRIINRQLKKASSFIVLPRESSSVQGYRTDGEGSSRGKISRLLDLSFKSDRWVFTMAPPFLVRASSPKGGGNSNSSAERTSSSAHSTTPSAVDSPRPPV